MKTPTSTTSFPASDTMPCSPVCVMGDGGRAGKEGCGRKAVAEMKCNLRNKWVPICGMHRSALLRRKPPSKPAEIRDLANDKNPSVGATGTDHD